MQMNYRGVKYDSTPAPVVTISEDQTLTYRGVTVNASRLERQQARDRDRYPIINPLTYRGLSYGV